MSVTITIRNVPDGTRDLLAARADQSGQSMQEYVRELLIDHGQQPTRAELLRRVQELWAKYPDVRPTTDESAAELVRQARAERTRRILGDDEAEDA